MPAGKIIFLVRHSDHINPIPLLLPAHLCIKHKSLFFTVKAHHNIAYLANLVTYCSVSSSFYSDSVSNLYCLSVSFALRYLHLPHHFLYMRKAPPKICTASTLTSSNPSLTLILQSNKSELTATPGGPWGPGGPDT